MRRIGLTGTVAAGKSEVGRLFESWGAVRIDADQLAREAVRAEGRTLARVRDLLGDEVIGADGGLDRPAVRRRVFADDAIRQAFEEIVHAEIKRLRDVRVAEARLSGAPFTVEEIPLLFESGLADHYDAIVVVDAPVAVRRERAGRSRNWSREEFDAVEAAQAPGEEKRRLADHVIDNSGSRDDLVRRAGAVWSAITGAQVGAPPGRKVGFVKGGGDERET